MASADSTVAFDPSYWTVTEAAERLAKATGKPWTPDWILQCAGEGRFPLFAIMRDWVRLQPPGLQARPIDYKVSDYVEIGSDLAKWMFAESSRVITPGMLPIPDLPGYPGWIIDVSTGRRRRLEIREADLYVRLEDMERIEGAKARTENKGGRPTKDAERELAGEILDAMLAIACLSAQDLAPWPAKVVLGVAQAVERAHCSGRVAVFDIADTTMRDWLTGRFKKGARKSFDRQSVPAVVGRFSQNSFSALKSDPR